MSMNSRAGFIKTEEDALNDREALRLRSKGYTYREIADQLSVDTSTAYRRTQRALAAIPQEDVTQYRALEAQRLDAMHQVAFERALEGNLAAIDRVLAIGARRAKLLGLNTPTQTEVTGVVGMVNASLTSEKAKTSVLAPLCVNL